VSLVDRTTTSPDGQATNGLLEVAELKLAAEVPGLEQHQHPRWEAWHCWTTLVIAAQAFVAAATEPPPPTRSA
jgi:hypothetical protein